MLVTAMKNLGDWLVVSVVYFVIGFALMFGDSVAGLVGSDLFLGIGLDGLGGLGWSFFLFQLAFAGTAATIVSGAMAERTGFKAYLLFAVFMGAVIYPVFGHWVWGRGVYADNESWLAALGFVDFAGGSAVHLIGAGAALAGVIVVGPRMGRYGADGSVKELESGGLMWSVVGTMVLWFGWFGFNGGSALTVSADLGLVVFNTNIGGAIAGVTGFAHAQLFQSRRNTVEKTLGAALGGLVAVTAGANLFTPVTALAIGAVAGVLHNLSFELIIYRWRLDDVAGAIPVHGFCGLWGVLCVGLFGDPTRLTHPFATQLGVQALGAAVALVWSFGLSYGFFVLVKRTIGVRVDPMREVRGLSLSHKTEEEDDVDDELDSLFNDTARPHEST